MNKTSNRVCPLERAGGLDNMFRKLIHNPKKILGKYIKDGMAVLDVGCGPGLFSIAMAELVGESGLVIAADLQAGMLEKLKSKIQGKKIAKRIKLCQCEKNKIGILEKVDFVLAFYMVHEVPDQEKFFNEIVSILKPKGKILVIEPRFHVSKKAFKETVKKAAAAGLRPVEKPGVLMSRTVVLEKSN